VTALVVAGSVLAAPKPKPQPPAPGASASASAPASAKVTPAQKPAAKSKPKPKPKPPAPCSPRWRPYVPQGYRVAVESWHRPAASSARTDAHQRPYLTLEVLNTNERIEIEPQADTGRFAASDLDRLAHAMRDTRRGNEHPIDPRLADLVYDLQVHFRANALRVISGYRTPSAGGHSNHGRGRAMDLIVPGVADADVAKYARAKGFTGVGVYPSSGFVHVDVRPSSYYWIDSSGPGQKNCERGTLGNEARTNDSSALAHGRKPPPAWSHPSPNVEALWREQQRKPPEQAESHEDLSEEDDLDSDHE
jgi:uncharacterized protein YcbK (DUF882 family)